MFKNPLKYASGGTMLPSEQQAENDFISVIAEGLGAQPEQVKARLEQIKSNPTESQQLQEALQLMQQDKNKGFQAVLSLFAGKPQSAKRGGKIQDFICKHGRGGAVAGCGCEKPVEKHQQENGKGRGIIGALSGLYNRFIGQRMPDVPGVNNRRVRTWTDANGIQHIVEDANVNGNSTITTIDINGTDTLGTQKITTGDGRYRMVNLQPKTLQWRSVMSRNVPQQENGGKVEKAQKGDVILQPGEETVWDIKKDTLRNGTLESHKWAKNNSTLPMSESEVRQWPGTYSRFIDGRDTILVRQTPMFKFYRSSLDPLHEIVTHSDGTPAGTNTYETRASWNKENQYHDKLK